MAATNTNEQVDPTTLDGAQNLGDVWNTRVTVGGASTAGISGQERAIMRKTIPWTLAAFVLTGIATVVLVLIMR